MFPSGTPLVTQFVIYGVLLAFDFGAAISVYGVARRAIETRFAKRAAAALNPAQ